MRVLVLGASGLLGRQVYRHLRCAGMAVAGTGHTRTQARSGPDRTYERLVHLDAHDLDAVAACLDDIAAEVVINAIGERRPAHWSPRELHALNVALPRALASHCQTTGAWLIHISSDYVFDGRLPPHAPGDPRRPLNPYGRSKADGEDAARRACPGTTILRVPVLHGPVQYAGESNLSSLIPLVTAAGPVLVDDWAIRYPTATGDVAATVRQLINCADDLQGRVAHWSGNEAMTKYAMAQAIATALDVPTGHLQPLREPHPTRPHHPRLDCALLEGLGLGVRTPLLATLPAVIASVPSPTGLRGDVR